MPSNNVGRNWKRTKESSLFGTRKLAFYTLTADPNNNLVGNITNGYSFRVNTTTGAVTFDADITARDIGLMTTEFSGNNDDEYYTVSPLPFNIEFLGGGSTDAIFINSNSGITFYNGESDRPGNNVADNGGTPEIYIANNDGNMQFLHYDTTGVEPNRQFRVKFRGNTDYNISDTVNLVWEAVFYEGQNYIDILVSQQPADWAAYDDGEGQVTWGVTNGTNWVDGLPDHTVSYAPFVSTAEELWKLPNSSYYQVVQAIQESGAEIYWLGTPHNNAESNAVDYSALTFADTADSFTFAIADDADVPTAYLENTVTIGVNATTGLAPNTVEFDGVPNNVYIGQRVTFNGTMGGLVAGKNYYVVSKGLYLNDTRMYITVSDTVEREVLDIVYPEGPGGEPGPEVTLAGDVGYMVATFYNYNIEWQGTAGDTLSSCCYNLTNPGVVPGRLMYFISQSDALPNGMWWMERSNPSWGIFPSWWEGGANI